jgi:methylated-DNA-[protein]-cysteine S-methyltransferase
MTLLYDTFDSPIGALTVAGDSQGIHHILFETNRYDAKGREHWQRDAHALLGARAQLLEYLHGERVRFDLPLAPHGTPFQLRVWKALADIPFGQTWSYVELARHIDHPTASRAVGSANGRNPLPIVLPCHRVIGSSGALTGFGGGLQTKAALLQLEARRDSLFA